MIEAFLRLACALVIVSGLAVFGWTVTLRLESGGRLARWVAAFVASTAMSTIVFVALAFARLVGLPSMLAASLSLAAGGFLVAGRERIAAAFFDDVRAIREAPKRVGWPVAVVVAIVFGVHGLRAGASACSVPLGFDTLTYHLVHVAYWAQDGGFERHPGIDAWSYYEFFPVGGDILWAWVAIPTRSSVLVGAAGAFLSAMTALGTISAARSLGANLGRSALAASALVALPAVLSFATNGYVDNAALAFVVAGTALFLSAVDATSARLRGILLVGSTAAFGLAVGVKPTMLAFLGLGLLSNAVLLIARRARFLEIAGILVGGLVAALTIFGPRMLYVAAQTGSAMYPFPVRVLGHEISRGNLALQRVFIDPTSPDPPLSALVWELFFPRPTRRPLNFDIAGIALFAAAALGLVFWLRRRPRDARALLLVGLALPALTYFTGETTHGLRTLWWWVIARFMTPAAFSAALFASTVPNGRVSRVVDVLLCFAALAGLVVPMKNGMCEYRWVGAACLVFAFAGVVALSVVAWRRRRGALPIVLALGTVAFAAVTAGLRVELEDLILRGAARGECFEAQSLKRSAGALPLWEHLADATPKRIAVAAGFENVGHGVFRYPLLGRRWQHTLLYVTPAADGELYEHPDLYLKAPPDSRPELSFDRWHQRLRDERVDVVVLLGPYNLVEHRWLGSRPDLFHLEVITENDAARLYSVTR